MLSRASEGTLSCSSPLHLQSLTPTNPFLEDKKVSLLLKEDGPSLPDKKIHA
jgi:hypothetical protein